MKKLEAEGPLAWHAMSTLLHRGVQIGKRLTPEQIEDIVNHLERVPGQKFRLSATYGGCRDADYESSPNTNAPAWRLSSRRGWSEDERAGHVEEQPRCTPVLMNLEGRSDRLRGARGLGEVRQGDPAQIGCAGRPDTELNVRFGGLEGATLSYRQLLEKEEREQYGITPAASSASNARSNQANLSRCRGEHGFETSGYPATKRWIWP